MLLRPLYIFLKYLTRFISYLFFEKTTLIGQKYYDLKRPCIVVSNHPNTLLDPVVVAGHVPQNLHFLGNAGLFAHPISDWIFRTLWCIPIKRKQDNAQNVNNQDSFKQCDDFLRSGGCLYIAPEGTSYQDRHLQTIKTGTARIALSAEAHSDFRLGLTIQPFGISYSRKGHFGSKMVLEAVSPIVVADYKDLFQKDEEAAVDAITEDIQKRLRSAMIDTEDQAQDRLLAMCERLLLEEKDSTNESTFRQSQQLSTNLQTLKKNDFTAYENLKDTVNQFFINFKKQNISYLDFSRKTNYAYLFIGFPIFLIGFLLNIIPFQVVRLIWKKLTPDGYDATVQYVGALVFFSIFYTFEKNILQQYVFTFSFFGWFFWTIALFSGKLAWLYYTAFKGFFTVKLMRNKVEMIHEKNNIIETLKNLSVC